MTTASVRSASDENYFNDCSHLQPAAAIVGLNFVLANVGWALTLSTQLEISRRAEVKQQTSADSANLSQPFLCLLFSIHG